jgi:hypothetical protein
MDDEKIMELVDDQVGRIVCALLTQAVVRSSSPLQDVMRTYIAMREAMGNEIDG